MIVIGEPEIECICDECGADEIVRPEYRYNDYSGNSGYYDCEDGAIVKLLDGWVMREDKLLCDECVESE